MAKRKTPTELTPEQLSEHREKDEIANFATRSEKTAWQRQHEKLEQLVKKLEPIEDKLLSLTTQKMTIIDELMVIRRELVESCIHPFEMLVKHEGHMICKFCEKKISTARYNNEHGA